MPLIARRGSVSSRAYGQLARTALPTITTYGGNFRFDNNNDVSLFFFTKSTRLTVSPFTTLSTIYKSATTNDLDTWTTYNGFVSPAIDSSLPWWGTGKYHVADSSYRQWMQTYYDSTVNVTTDPGNVFTQNVSTDGLVTWTRVTNNIVNFADVKTSAYLNAKTGVNVGMMYGDTIFRNFGGQSQFSNVGPFGPQILQSTDAGVNYAEIMDTTHRVLPMTAPAATSASGPKFGNALPYLQWTGSFNSYDRPPVGIWGRARNLTEVDRDYYVGSGGTLFINGGGMGKTTYTFNQPLRALVGKYTWLYKVSARGNRIVVFGWGCLPSDWATGTQKNFAAVSTNGGLNWTLADSSITTLFTLAWNSPFAFNGPYFVYDDGTKWWVASNSGTTQPIATSTDGITWTTNTAATTALGTARATGGIAVNGSTWLIGASDGSVIRSTDSGVTWAKVTVGSGEARSIVWNGSRFIYMGQSRSAWSTDGSTWTTTSNNWASITGITGVTAGDKVDAVATSGGQVYALVQNQRVVKTSDGITWSLVGSNTLDTYMNNLGRGARVLSLYEDSLTSFTLVAIGDWATAVLNTSTDTGSTWGAWSEITNMWSDEMAPPVNGATGFQPVMTPLINSTLTITAGGTGYTSGKVNVRFSKPDSLYGWEPAVNTITVTSGAISAISLYDSGAGYTTPPTVTITDAAGVGAGATATCSFVNSTANASIQMNRIMYWDYNKFSIIDAKSVGAGWYGTNPMYGITDINNTFGVTGNTIWTGAVVKASTDVTDATASYSVKVCAGTTAGSFHNGINAETDNPGIMHTIPFTFLGGYNTGDGASRRIFYGDYMDATNWGWNNPAGGAADVYATTSTNILSCYIAGKAFLRPGYFPIYDSTIAPSIAGATAGIAWYVAGYTAQSVNDSTGASKIVYNPAVKKYAFLPATGDWQLLADGEIPTGSWTLTLDSTNSQNSPGFGGSPLLIVSNGTDPSNKATTVLAWTNFYRPFNNFSVAGVGPLVFITTDGGVTWAEHTALFTWMAANGYLNLVTIQWNQNEGKWVMLMSKIAATASQTVPYDTVITADFVTYVVKPNADTVNIPTT